MATQHGAKPGGHIHRSLGLRKGQDFTEYDLMYVNTGRLFWGVQNVVGRGFEKPENRPTNLQIPMVRN